MKFCIISFYIIYVTLDFCLNSTKTWNNFCHEDLWASLGQSIVVKMFISDQTDQYCVSRLNNLNLTLKGHAETSTAYLF